MTDAVAAAALDAGRPTLFRQAMLLATLTFVAVLYAMTVTVANVALPQMQGSLSSTPDQIAWIVTSSIVATAIVTPMSGWLAAVLGRRRLMIWSVVGFGISSILCGLATSVPELVLYRIGQGAFGAPLVPLSQAIVLESFPERSRGRVLSIWGTGVVMGPILAPALGGALTEAYNWRWVFFMLVPFTVVALIGVLLFIRRETGRPAPPRLDWIGFGTLAVAIASLQLALDRGERAGWLESWEVLSYFGICLSALWVFVVRNATSPRPFLNPALLRDRNYVVGIFLIFIFGLLNFTPITLLPTMLQTIQGYPETIIGNILSARGAGTFVGFASMFVIGRLDPRIPMLAGMVLQAWAGWMMAGFNVNVTSSDVLWASAIQGLGVGLMWIPLSIVAFETLPKALLPDGTGLFHLLRNIGSSVSISIAIALVIRESKLAHAGLAPHVSQFSEALRMPGSQGWRLDDPASLARIAREMGRQATMIGYIDVFLLFTVTAVIAIPFVLLVRRGNGRA